MFYTSTDHTYMRIAIHVSGLLIRAQLIRFSYATNMSRPQGSGSCRLRTKSRRKHIKYLLMPHVAVNNACIWFNIKLINICKINILIPQFTAISNLLWLKGSH